jgi:adenine-specific DNA-methyltransferase
MDKHSSIRLLDKTFGQDYNRDRFCRFIKEIFNRFEINIRTWAVWPQYEEYIKRYSSLGTFIDGNERRIEVLEVELKKTSSRDKARTMQRNFIAKYLKKYMKDAAIVAFYGDNPSDWRFSFVKLEYDLEKGELLTPARRYSYLVGKNEPNHTAKSQLIDLLLDEQNIPLLETLENAFSIEKVTKEFFNQYKELFLELKEELENIIKNNENVKHEFKEKYIDIIEFAKRLLGQIVFIYFLQKKGWLGLSRDTTTGKFKDWGYGPKDFLRRLFEKRIIDYENFFNDILEPLFYEALARPREDEDSYYSRFDCKIPFLNGGLFEPLNDYSWYSIDILIDNKIFKKIFDTFDTYNFTVKEDEPLEKEVAVDPEMLGKVFENLLEVKDRKSKGAFYTPREIVHYMCQQTLINYLETNINIRRENIELFIHLGDFTNDGELELPDEIVNNYNKIDELLKNVKIADPAVGSGAYPVGMMNEIVKARSVLSKFYTEEIQNKRTNYNLKRETIENSLYGVDIEPSAVDIAQLRFWLSLIVDEQSIEHIRPLPNLDHKIMCGNSLLEEFECKNLFDESILKEPEEDKSYLIEDIEIKKSRLYKEFHDIHTGKRTNRGRSKEIERELKKLDRQKKNILGRNNNDINEQVSLHENFDRKLKESQKKLSELKDFHSKYFNEQSREKKKKYVKKIDAIEWEFIEETLKEQNSQVALEHLLEYKKKKVKPFFLWKLYFAEVFQDKSPGFDIVIANPPYLGEKGNKEIFRVIKETKFGKRFYKRKMDLFYFFFHKSLDIAKTNGIISFITTNYFITADGAINLRKDFFTRASVYKMINFNELRIFDSAKGQHNMISILKKTTNSNDFFTELCITKRTGNANNRILSKILSWGDEQSDYFMLKKDDLYDGDERYIRFINNQLTENESILEDILLKISSNSILLGKIKNVNQGVLSGVNNVTARHIKKFGIDENEKGKGVFVINKSELNNLELNDHEEKLIKPYYKNSDIFRYFTHTKRTKRYLIYLTRDIDIEDYPIIKNHIFKYRQVIENRSQDRGEMQAALKLGKWWVIFAARPDVDFEGEKIVFPQRSPCNTFGYNEKSWYAGTDVYFITNKNDNKIELKYILALLNSKLMYVWLYFKGKRKGELLELLYKPITEIPVKEINDKHKNKITDYINQIIKLTNEEDFIDNKNKQIEVKNISKSIDEILYEAYNFSNDEIDYIESFCKQIEIFN